MNKKAVSKRKQLHSSQLKPVYAAVLLAFAIETAANPMDATVVSGQASFATTGNTLTVVNTPGTIINWQSFSIGQSEITNFIQQSASSAVLNRVIGNDPSNILGTLQSNGRVFLINPHGIAFGAGSVVDVAGLVASTLNISDADFQAGRYNFTEVPGAQNVSNAGNITAQDSGQIYLIAPNVENSGVITAPNGEIYLAAGSSVELVNSNDPNLRVSITAPAGDATNVGQLIASSGSLGLYGTVVRNSGTVSADSATLQGGRIVFRASERVEAGGTISASGAGGGEIKVLADMQGGTVNVTGTLDASAPVSGDGGYIDTSAAHVQIADSASITTAAASGNSGNWLIDPTDFYISAIDPANGSSWMSNTTLSNSLGLGNVTIQTLATGTGNGDIFVNDAVGWSTSSNLSLNAHRDIVINAPISSGGINKPGSFTARADLNGTGTGTIVFGPSGSVVMQGGFQAVFYGAINLYYNPTSYTTPTDYSPYVNGNPNLTAAMLVNDVTQLQAMNTNLAGAYALGRDIDATATATWNAGAGFVPIGNATTNFTGRFDGLGHTIGNLTINRPAETNVGLFGAASGSIFGVGLTNASVTGQWRVGALAGSNNGMIGNSWVNASVVAGLSSVGGLAGYNLGGISGSYVSGGSVTGTGQSSPAVGGLVGWNDGYTSLGMLYGGSITVSYVSGGTVSGFNGVGGLAGLNDGAIGGNSHVVNSTVSASYYVGGLVGSNFQTGNINGGYVGSSTVIGTSSWGIGGLAGQNLGAISNSYVDNGIVKGVGALAGTVGGLVGQNWGAIDGSYVSGGSVSGAWSVGGLVGQNGSTGSISNSYASGGSVVAFTLSLPVVGGLAGNNMGLISNSYVSNGSVGVAAAMTGGSGYVGGLVGSNAGSISNSYVTGGVVDGNGAWDIGGLVGFNGTGGNIGTSYATGSVAGLWGHGGVAGWNDGIIANSFWNSDFAGLIGINVTGVGSATNVVGLTSAQMLSSLNFTGFDFLNTWWISEGNTRPFLRSEWSANITNSHQLQLMTMNLGASYTLGANINMAETVTGVGMWGSAGFVPLGNFSGTLDGQGHTVNNLYINRPTTASVGLFSWLNMGSAVSNLGLVGGSVTGWYEVGGLAGYSDGSINNSYVSGMSVAEAGSTTIGGLVGQNGWYGSITNSYVDSGTVTGGNWRWVGGLAGLNDGTISNSHVSNITVAGASAGSVGGLVGWNTSSGFISNSYVSNGNVTGGTSVGGLVGWNTGSVNSSYINNGSVTGNWNIGGLVGLNSNIVDGGHANGASVNGISQVGGLVGWNGGAISNSYVGSGSVTGTVQFGGLVGSSNVTNPINNSHYNISGVTINGTNQVTRFGLYNDVLNIGGTGQYDDWYSGGLLTPLNIADYAMLSGSAGSYTISSVQGMKALLGFADNIAYTFSLAANIDLISLPGYYVPLLAANFNGANFTISNLSINQANDNLGLFGLVGIDGMVSNVNLLNASVTGGKGVGALAGWNEGNIVSSSSTGGNVSGNWDVGGLVGHNHGIYTGTSSAPVLTGGSISNSFASGGSVVGGLNGSNIGGLVGDLGSGAISGSYVSGGNVSGGWNVGGLAGRQGANYMSGSGLVGPSSISNSYVSTGTIVSGSSSVGGLVGNARNGSISNSYVTDGIVSGSWVNVGGLVGFDGGEGMLIDSSRVIGGSVIGLTNVGGLVGYNGSTMMKTNSIITNSYVSSGNISGTLHVGGLVGYNASGSASFAGSIASYWGSNISNSYVDTGTIVSGSTNVGGLVGWNDGGTYNSYVSGGSVTGNSSVGGLVGHNAAFVSAWTVAYGGTISNSYVSTGTVINGGAGVGGLVGLNQSGIVGSFVDGATVTGSVNVGGLVGQNIGGNGGNGGAASIGVLGTAGFAGTNASVSGSYASGVSVSGISGIGGLVGQNIGGAGGAGGAGAGSVSWWGGVGGVGGAATIANSYVSGGTVTGSGSDVGGLVGNNISGVAGTAAAPPLGGAGGAGGVADISTSYASNASISGVTNAGGIAGNNTGSISNTFWNSDTAGALPATGINTGTLTNVVGYTTAQMMSMSSFTGWSIANTGGAGMTWRIYEGYTGPQLTSFLKPLTIAADPVAADYTGASYTGGLVNPVYTSDGVTLVAVDPTHILGSAYGNAVNVGVYAPVHYSDQLGYDITFVNGALSINPVLLALSVTANDATKTYGTTYTFTGTEFTSAGLVGTDTIGSVTLSSSGAVNTANVGAYAITPNNAVFSSGLAGNYSITYVDGTLAVTPAPLTVTADPASKIYGDLDPGFTYQATGLLFTDTLSGGLSRVAGQNVGSYAITLGTLSNPNYVISYAGNFLTIAARAVDIIASASSKVYGDAEPNLFTVGGTGLASWDTQSSVFTGSLGHTGGENVGTYTGAITIGSLAANANYTIANFTTNDLTITPATLTIAANDLNKILTTTDPLLTYTVYGLKLTDTAATMLTGELVRGAGETVGTYQIDQGTLAVTSSNYLPTYTYVPGVFTILAPTVINEIVDISLQDTGSATTEEEKKVAQTVVADASVTTENTETQALPVCQ